MVVRVVAVRSMGVPVVRVVMTMVVVVAAVPVVMVTVRVVVVMPLGLLQKIRIDVELGIEVKAAHIEHTL